MGANALALPGHGGAGERWGLALPALPMGLCDVGRGTLARISLRQELKHCEIITWWLQPFPQDVFISERKLFQMLSVQKQKEGTSDVNMQR